MTTAARYYQTRSIHIRHGNIVAGADSLARAGDYAAALAWLAVAEGSDWVRKPGRLKATLRRRALLNRVSQLARKVLG